MTDIEEQIAHMSRTLDDLSDVVARQASEIETLTRRVALLMQREAAREVDDGGHVYGGTQRPPHY